MSSVHRWDFVGEAVNSQGTVGVCLECGAWWKIGESPPHFCHPRERTSFWRYLWDAYEARWPTPEERDWDRWARRSGVQKPSMYGFRYHNPMRVVSIVLIYLGFLVGPDGRDVEGWEFRALEWRWRFWRSKMAIRGDPWTLKERLKGLWVRIRHGWL